MSNIVSEVAQGMRAPALVAETVSTAAAPRTPPPTNVDATEKRRKLMDAIGADAYNGVNLFEDTSPLTSYESSDPKPGSVDLGDPRDAGVDISSFVGGASKMWEAMK